MGRQPLEEALPSQYQRKFACSCHLPTIRAQLKVNATARAILSMTDPSKWSHSTGEEEQYQASVAVSGKAKDLAATISSGKSAQNEREAKRRAREEKEEAAKEQKWKEQRDREREKDKEQA